MPSRRHPYEAVQTLVTSIPCKLFRQCRLWQLDLSRCEVDRPGAEALVRSLASNNSLTRCHFNGNPCGDGQLRAALARSHLSLTEVGGLGGLS